METELCEHCKKEVPAENYLMHSAHCKRNIQLCPLCGQAISRKDAKEHLQEYHEKIDCVQCGQKTTRIDEENQIKSNQIKSKSNVYILKLESDVNTEYKSSAPGRYTEIRLILVTTKWRQNYANIAKKKFLPKII